MSWISKYGKSLAAAFALIITAVQAGLSDNHLTQAEQLQIAIAAITAGTIYLAPNLPRYPLCKTVLAVLGAALTVAVTLIDNGISPADWTAIILGGLTVIMVGAAPAQVQLPRQTPYLSTTGPTTRLATTDETEVREP